MLKCVLLSVNMRREQSANIELLVVDDCYVQKVLTVNLYPIKVAISGDLKFKIMRLKILVWFVVAVLGKTYESIS